MFFFSPHCSNETENNGAKQEGYVQEDNSHLDLTIDACFHT